MQDLFTSFQSALRGYMQRRIVKKKLFRHDAVGILQRNLLAYNQLQSDPWWTLYMKMKPLITATRAAEEQKIKKAAIAAMESKIAEEVKTFVHSSEIENSCG
jgi:myosin heavy chain 9/10/11/14